MERLGGGDGMQHDRAGQGFKLFCPFYAAPPPFDPTKGMEWRGGGRGVS